MLDKLTRKFLFALLIALILITISCKEKKEIVKEEKVLRLWYPIRTIVLQCVFLKDEIKVSDLDILTSAEIRIADTELKCKVQQYRTYGLKNNTGAFVALESLPIRKLPSLASGCEIILKDKNSKEVGKAILGEFNLTDKVTYCLSGKICDFFSGSGRFPFPFKDAIVESNNIQGEVWGSTFGGDINITFEFPEPILFEKHDLHVMTQGGTYYKVKF